MKIRLRPDLLEKAKTDITRYAVSEKANIARGTAYSLLGKDAASMQRVDLDTLAGVLDAIGLSIEEVGAMTITDLFTVQAD